MLRAQLTGRVVHRVNDKATAEMGLADISPEAVMAATQIVPEMPGVAVAGDASGGWSRIRTPNLSLAEAVAICRQTAHLVPDLPTLDPFRPYVPPVAAPADAVPLVRPRPVTE
jgi:S-DNA-T family DNA segregation ATPase FtsK/SpoIIIE